MDKIYILHGPSRMVTIAKRKCFRPGETGEGMVHKNINAGMLLIMGVCVCAAGEVGPVHAYWLAAT